jgi:hypothetical protein
MAKKKVEKGKGQSSVKRQRSDVQNNRHRTYQAYVVQPSINPSPVPAVSSSSQDKTRQAKTRQDTTRQDKTRQDKTSHDKPRQDKTRQDKTRRENT